MNLAEINFATGLRAHLQSISLGSLCALSGLAIAGAALTLGISEELVSRAILSLGIGNIGPVLTEKEIEQIKEWVQTRPIDSSLSYHVLKDKHGFNNKCGPDCILQVANNLRIKNAWIVDNRIPVIRGTGNCRHGCTIEVRMSIPPKQETWNIGTAFHTEPCKA